MLDVTLIHGALGARDQPAPLDAALVSALGDRCRFHRVELQGHGTRSSNARNAAKRLLKCYFAVLPKTRHPFEQVRLPLLAAHLTDFFDAF